MKKLLRFDWASKNLLKSKSHFGILEGFLLELTGSNYKIKGILGSSNQINGAEERSSRIDFLAESGFGEVIIQIQNNRESNYMQRMLYGSMKSVVDNFQGYSSLKARKVICVNIVYSPTQDEDYFYKGKIIFNPANKNGSHETGRVNGYSRNDLKDMFPEYFVIYVYNFKDSVKSCLDEWFYYLKHGEVLDSFNACGLKELKEKFDIQRLSEDEKKKYESFLNLISNDPLEILQLRLKTESLLKEKERLTKMEIARALKNQFVPPDIISASTGLSLMEVQSL